MDLKVNDLYYTIENKNIVNGVSLHVEDKKFVTILGPNGCGKSTLLKNIYRVLKPKHGEIFLNDKNIKEYSLKESARLMAVVSQFNNLNFDCTVKEVVVLGRTPHLKMMEKEHKADHQIVDEAIHAVGLDDKKEQSYLSLSGGEKQRVVLARAITQKPQLLILDEPTNHLDIKYQLQILNIVKSLNISVLAVLHDISMAYHFSDYIYLMKEGRFIKEGKKEDIINKENIKETYDVDCDIKKQNESILINYF